MRKLGLILLVGLLALAFMVPTQAATSSTNSTYSVLYAKGASAATARSQIKSIGGTVVKENLRVGLAQVTTTNPNFLSDVGTKSALYGAVDATTPVGQAERRTKRDVERETGGSVGTDGEEFPAVNEPLEPKLWGMDMIDASDGSWAVEQGDPGVLVGIIDTGIDASHPDLAPNVNVALSRNFTTDIPLIDGPCEEEPDRSCKDRADVDEGGHGTHVAGTVAAALNGLGVAGVAPDVTLVNLRAGQDSGWFFLQPTVDALTYAGDIGVDVANMSFFTDPWMYNCPNGGSGDGPNEIRQQRTVIEAVSRALDYAHAKGVTLVASAGNDHQDLDNKQFDDSSPNYPPGSERPRTIDNSCLDMPAEGPHVIMVSAVGPSGRKAYYSNYGTEVDVAAPGGDRREFFGTQRYNSPATRILSTYPRKLAREEGLINGRNQPLHPLAVVDCRGTGENRVCGVYVYLQGTSMAAPHASGVAALIVSVHGVADPVHGGLKMNPDEVKEILQNTAEEQPCPPGGFLDYPDPDLPAEFDAHCEGTAERNTFYGHGIVNALNAVTGTTS